VNTSPVVGLYDDPTGSTAAILAMIAAGPATTDLRDDDGVRHRLWVVEADGDGADLVRRLIAAAGAGPITIADGHHRYETAVRYRDERRMSRSCEEDPAFDYLLMLLLETTAEPLTVLPTHRLVRGIEGDRLARLLHQLDDLFESRSAGRGELERTFGDGLATGGAGRFGLWTRDGGAVLTARREAFDSVASGVGDQVRKLDVWLLGAALERAFGIDDVAVAAGDRIAYTKSVSDAMARVDASEGGTDAAFLLEPTPVPSIMSVAQAGEVMPQKSTYFYPKALTGLVINPHEW
jgi:uncharacterized protein (DUF1015 family)